MRSKVQRLVTVDRLVLSVFLIFALYAVLFVAFHGDTVLNRFTDSWWHIAAADEFVRTGVFAKDPFFENAPRFVPFGLMECAVAGASLCLGRSSEVVFPGLVACGVAAFIGFTFVAGWMLRRSAAQGAVCALASAALFTHTGLIGLGMPFAVGSALLAALIVSLWSQHHYERGGVIVGVLHGVVLGLLFDLHAFAGLAGCVFVGVAVLRAIWLEREAPRRSILKAAALTSAFLAVSWPWLYMHLSVYGALQSTNAHVIPRYAVEARSLYVLLGIIALMVMLRLTHKKGADGQDVNVYLLSAGVIGLLCLPLANGFVSRLTSFYMARRVPLLFPIGVPFAMAYGVISQRGQSIIPRFVVGAMCFAILVVPVGRLVTRSVYLMRTSDYDNHAFGYLRSLGAITPGEVVLSDPTTSYFARGMVGVYAVTVPAGHASPLIDYAKRDRDARESIAGGQIGPGALNIDAVLVDRRNGATARFTGVSERDIINAWKRNGWSVIEEDANVVVLRDRSVATDGGQTVTRDAGND